MYPSVSVSGSVVHVVWEDNRDEMATRRYTTNAQQMEVQAGRQIHG